MIDLDQARRRAKELVREGRRLRDDRPPNLADAQREVARELGFASWPAMVHAVAADALDSVHVRHGVPVRVRVRAGTAYVDDQGWAVDQAGKPSGWREAAQAAVLPLSWNVRRNGVVFMQCPVGPRLERVIDQTALAARAVYDALLSLED